MTANTAKQAIETLTPDEFAAKYLPVLEARDAQPETPDDYFVRNLETGKLELHFAKATYTALSEDAKKRIKGAFLWGRNSGCWISRCKEPNLWDAERVAKSLGLYDAGKSGERLSYAEQMDRKAERAERRADRYEARSEAAHRQGEALQKPINDMHGDIAFFTQPNINTSAGRAFTRRRERMFAAFDRGFEEFRKSAYWQDRAKIARATAQGRQLQDKGFVMRRIKERESDIRKLQKLVTLYEGYVNTYESGETPKDHYGSPITMSAERCAEWLEHYLDQLEAKLDELGFYQDCLDRLGGVTFSRENIKPGYIVKMKRWGNVAVVSTGPQNFTHKTPNSPVILTDSYAEIIEVIRAVEAVQGQHPFKVGDTFTCDRWNPSLGRHGDTEKVTYRIIRATEKSVTLQTGDEKPFIRKPVKREWRNDWQVSVTDWTNGTWFKAPEESK